MLKNITEMEGKTYSQNEISEKFRNKKCLECTEGILVLISSGWVSKYKCTNCNIRYEFQESDMGQSLPYLESNT